jgi:branched-subunit amino acid transport protein
MNIRLIIIGMTIVTYLPRLLPLVLLQGRHIPKRLRRFLMSIPYAALGALIIPGALHATPGLPIAGWIGLIAAFLYAWFKGGLIVPVMISVITTFLILVGWG